MTVQSYEEKVNSLDAQIDALGQAMRIKLEQADNKIPEQAERCRATASSSWPRRPR